jgi:hypothetical protein
MMLTQISDFGASMLSINKMVSILLNCNSPLIQHERMLSLTTSIALVGIQLLCKNLTPYQFHRVLMSLEANFHMAEIEDTTPLAIVALTIVKLLALRIIWLLHTNP